MSNLTVPEFDINHEFNLPTIRIIKATISNFKSVSHGEIVFDCGTHFVPFDTKSDILGIYGQNGSGKTSFIEALSILKYLMSGKSVPDVYAECISKKAEYAKLEFTFDLQYPNDDIIRTVEYKFCLRSVKNEKYDSNNKDPFEEKNRVEIFDEVISVKHENNKKKQKVIDTSESEPFGPISMQNELFDKSDKNELIVSKELALKESKSFIFSLVTLNIFDKSKKYSLYYQILLEFHLFATEYFFVVDTKTTGLINLNAVLPLYARNINGSFKILLRTDGEMVIPNALYYNVADQFKSINILLSQLIPGLSVKIREISQRQLKDGRPGKVIEFIADRDGLEIPLRDESDGVRKIISILCLIIAAYNDRSCTVAVDEFDSGVFEYLLGEILEIFEESGKGQFIFTSHNLRPLEIIGKRYLYFTTTNPENRYIKLKNISNSNNLRSTYFREIILGEQDEKMYNRAKKHKIISAFRMANPESEDFEHVHDPYYDFNKLLEKSPDLAVDYAMNEFTDDESIGDLLHCLARASSEGSRIAKSNIADTIFYKYKESSSLDLAHASMLQSNTTSDILEQYDRDELIDSSYKEVFEEEKDNLDCVEKVYSVETNLQKSFLKEIDNETWYMSPDEFDGWRNDNASNIEINKKIKELNKQADSPYFARIDTSSDGENSTFYISEFEPSFEIMSSLEDNMPKNSHIISAWSPIGMEYNNRNNKFSINGEKHSTLLRRQLDIKEKELLNCYEEFNASDTSKKDITDPFLIKILKEKKNEKELTNIIRSIQKKQNEIICAPFEKSLVVQGCAGSGKTMILLHRLAFMLYCQTHKEEYPNIKTFKPEKVKIITPNRNLKSFLKDISRNLKIEDFNMMTLSEYWFFTLKNYRTQSLLSNKSDDLNYIKELFDSIKYEKLDYEIQKVVYSEEFATLLKEKIEDIPTFDGERKLPYSETFSHNKKTNKGAEAFIISAINATLKELNVDFKVEGNKTNYECIMYAKVLAAFLYYGPLSERMREEMICVDEGQDISVLQYALMSRVNDNNAILNIYGDLHQQIPNDCHIEDWARISQILKTDISLYELNENYRNTEDIIEYYRDKLGLSDIPVGNIKNFPVEEIKRSNATWQIYIQILLNNRLVVITNKPISSVSEIGISNFMDQYFSFGTIEDGKVPILNIKQVKGLEFNAAFVLDNDMNDNEKYIAYTRALSELYIIR